MSKLYTTKAGAEVLGIKQDTLKHYAIRLGIGVQPGGPRTPYLFTEEEILSLRNRSFQYKWAKVEEREDREALGLGPMYNPDGSPRS